MLGNIFSRMSRCIFHLSSSHPHAPLRSVHAVTQIASSRRGDAPCHILSSALYPQVPLRSAHAVTEIASSRRGDDPCRIVSSARTTAFGACGYSDSVFQTRRCSMPHPFIRTHHFIRKHHCVRCMRLPRLRLPDEGGCLIPHFAFII